MSSTKPITKWLTYTSSLDDVENALSFGQWPNRYSSIMKRCLFQFVLKVKNVFIAHVNRSHWVKLKLKLMINNYKIKNIKINSHAPGKWLVNDSQFAMFDLKALKPSLSYIQSRPGRFEVYKVNMQQQRAVYTILQSHLITSSVLATILRK